MDAILAAKITGFRQTVKQFFTSKTNLAALAGILSTVAALYAGQMTPADAIQAILVSACALGLRDAVV